MVKSRPCIVRRINKDTLDLTRELLFEGFESKEVIPKNEAIIENVVVGHALLGVIRFLGVFQQYPWLQLGSISFANPCQFQFLLAVSRHPRIVPFRYHSPALKCADNLR